ncbi:putative beta-D-xylosidase 7 [Bulinus truncatus]|nr:putative beta-D-xylosidase 7 [Bulinus truncatus]
MIQCILCDQINKNQYKNGFSFYYGFLVEDTPGNEEWRRYPYRDTSLTWEQRVDDLVSRLTLEEIQDQLARGGTGDVGSPAPAIPRLGVGPYAWDSECLHGAAREEGNATSFPQSIGLAATFSPALVERMAAATGQEVRGKHNDFVKKGIFQTHTGASCFSPVINVVRDPRWGRNQETYGEDPFMSGKLSQSYVKGLHGYDSRYIQASSGCKHFDAYSGPENIPVSSISFDAKVSERDWKMTYLPAFKACVAAGTDSIMCSYNSINGVPACANKKLLTDILRTEWGFNGYVISDQAAIEFIQEAHNYTNSPLDTAVAAISAGCNLELSNNLLKPDYMYIVEAVHQGKLTEDLVRERVKPLFYTRMRLGEFDPPDNNPFTQLDSSVAESPEHQALALEAAMKSFVLLKNRNNFLPLQTSSYNNVAQYARLQICKQLKTEVFKLICGALLILFSLSGSIATVSLSGGFANGSLSVGFATGSLSGGIANGSLSGGFANGSLSGGFANGSLSGGFATGSLSGGFANGSLSGGFATGSLSGGFATGSLSGGFATGSLSRGFIVGPMANNTKQLSGDYSAVTDPSYFKNPLEGLKELFPNAVYENVCEDGNKCRQYRPDLVSLAVSHADLVFVVLGTGQLRVSNYKK